MRAAQYNASKALGEVPLEFKLKTRTEFADSPDVPPVIDLTGAPQCTLIHARSRHSLQSHACFFLSVSFITHSLTALYPIKIAHSLWIQRIHLHTEEQLLDLGRVHLADWCDLVASYNLWYYRRPAYAAIAAAIGGRFADEHAAVLATEPPGGGADGVPVCLSACLCACFTLSPLAPSICLRDQASVFVVVTVSYLFSLPLLQRCFCHSPADTCMRLQKLLSNTDASANTQL